MKMEFTREIYWNVGHSAITLIPMYLFVLVAVGILVKSCLQRIRMYKQGGPLNRTDQLGKRISKMAQNVFLQKKVVSRRWPGLLHGLFFWGFGLLLIGTTLIVIQADFTDLFFDIKFLKGTFYLIFSVTLDVAGLVCMVMLTGLLLRRYFFAPEGLKTQDDHAVMHGVLLAILLTGFLVEGARMAVTELGTSLSFWSPVGLLFAEIISGMGEGGLRALHKVTWWVHFFLVLTFIVLIPFTKFRHMVTTSMNYLFDNLESKGKLAKLDLEDEDAETFGATYLQELTWKDIFDTDACTLCMRCQDRCPAFATGKPLSPMNVIQQLGELAQNDPEASLIETFGEDVLWSCTTCGACQEVCPAAIEHVSKIVECRRAMVLMHATFPDEMHDTYTSLENQSNPWGFSEDTRADWCKELDVPLMADTPDADILWFVGCAGSFDDRAIETSKAIARVLKKAGVNFAILGREERCNGDMARRSGNEYLAQMMIAENVETFNRYKPKRILTSCPHCFNTIKNEYPEFGATYDVVSHVDFILELIESGSLTFKEDYPGKITYHDSCYLGRWNGVYDSPRKIISAIVGGENLVEMVDNSESAMCCGAGGGRMFMEETLGDRINHARCHQAIETGADTVTSACPFCLTMFRDGMRDTEGSQEVKDIAQLVDVVT
jgi:Fe-S oxidoreductase/nitrate reductase gamma subunit